MAKNKIQVKRTNTSGLLANVTDPANTKYIDAGELALNMADGILYSSNGSTLIEIGANNTNSKVTGTLTVNSISANGSTGLAGQVLSSNGSSTYWNTVGGTGTVTSIDSANGIGGGPITGTGTLYAIAGNSTVFVNASGIHVNTDSIPAAVNVDAQYIWTNTHTFNQTINGTANNTSFVGSVSAANVVSNAQLFGNLANYQTTAGLSANVATLTSNNTTYAFGKSENNLNVNSALNANNTSYVGSISAENVVSNAQLSSNLANYQTTVGLADNVATLTANNTSFVGTISAANVVSNAQLSSNLANYQTTAGLAGNVAALAANSASYLGGNSASDLRTYSDQKADNAYANAVSYVDGKSYVNSSQLSSNLSNYALLSGATFSGNVVANNANTINDLHVGRNLTVEGNLSVTGNVTVIGANNLSIVDNFIYLNSNNTTENIDIGFAGNYNDGTYKHTGFFRDATDGVWKVFDGYEPEPDANVNIDTSNTSFHLANFQANSLLLGNTTTNWVTANSTVINAVSYYVGATLIGNSTGPYGKTEGNLNVNNALTANNADYLGTIAAASYVINTDSRTLSGNLVFSGSNVAVTGNLAIVGGLIANGSLGTANQVLSTNGTSVYWANSGGGGSSNLSTQNTNPSAPPSGQLYWNNDLGKIIIYYQDGSSNQWVEASGIAGPKGDTGDRGFTGTMTIGTVVAGANATDANVTNSGNSTASILNFTLPVGGIQSLTAGNGINGGTITTTGTISIRANNGITSNSSGLFVTQGTGLVVNATGVHVNSIYATTGKAIAMAIVFG